MEKTTSQISEIRTDVTMKRITRLLWAIVMIAIMSSCVNTEKSSLRSSSYEPNIATRECLGFSRIVTSPLNYVGFFCADCYEAGPVAGTLLSPFILLKDVIGGTGAMSADILTGTVEMLTTLQFKDVSYPWESFNPEQSDTWFEVSTFILGTATEVANTYNAIHDGSSSSSTTSTESTTSGSAYLSGPTEVYCGNSYSYDLYVGGKRISSGVYWSVSGGGTTMYGNRLSVSSRVSNGSCKITAKYHGKYYTKLLQVK